MTDGDLRERRNQVRMELKKSETELEDFGEVTLTLTAK